MRGEEFRWHQAPNSLSLSTIWSTHMSYFLSFYIPLISSLPSLCYFLPFIILRSFQSSFFSFNPSFPILVFSFLLSLIFLYYSMWYLLLSITWFPLFPTSQLFSSILSSSSMVHRLLLASSVLFFPITHPLFPYEDVCLKDILMIQRISSREAQIQWNVSCCGGCRSPHCFAPVIVIVYVPDVQKVIGVISYLRLRQSLLTTTTSYGHKLQCLLS
jgi:hypothetical protein